MLVLASPPVSQPRAIGDVRIGAENLRAQCSCVCAPRHGHRFRRALLHGRRRWKGRGRSSNSLRAAGCAQSSILESFCAARGSSSRCSRFPDSSDAQQPARHNPRKCALKGRHAENTSRVDRCHVEAGCARPPCDVSEIKLAFSIPPHRPIPDTRPLIVAHHREPIGWRHVPTRRDP